MKNVATGYILFKLNYHYHFGLFFEIKVSFCTTSCPANKRATELKKLMLIPWQNLLHAQKLEKQGHNNGIKSYSYA